MLYSSCLLSLVNNVFSCLNTERRGCVIYGFNGGSVSLFKIFWFEICWNTTETHSFTLIKLNYLIHKHNTSICTPKPIVLNYLQILFFTIYIYNCSFMFVLYKPQK